MSDTSQERVSSLQFGAISEICARFEVKELALFGSVLRPDFRSDSDIDLLVEFTPGARVGLLRFIELQEDLSRAFGRKVDLVSKNGLRPLIRDEVLASAEVLYAA
jgi:hypothetical protein